MTYLRRPHGGATAVRRLHPRGLEAEENQENNHHTPMHLQNSPRDLQITSDRQDALPEMGLISTVREHGGYTTMYSCSDGDDSAIQETTLLFDFEIVIPNPDEPLIEVIVQDFPKVELGILFRMAQVTGLYPECDLLAKQLSDPFEKFTDTLSAGTETTRIEKGQFLSEENLIMGLSSWSPDSVDEVGECAFIKDFGEGNICVPVVGNMTIYYKGEDKQAIIDYMNHHLRKEMNDQQVSLGGPGGVKETFFIGTRERGGKSSGSQPPATSDSTPITRSTTEKTKLLPFILSAAFGVLFLLIFVMFITRRRSNRDSEEEEDFASAVQDLSVTTDKQEAEAARDMPILPVVAAPSRSSPGIPTEVTTQSPSPDEGEELPTYLPTTISTEGSAACAASETAGLSISSPPSTPENRRRGSGPVSVDMLPPLPPGGPSPKVAAAVVPAAGTRRRRKKKKKKRPVSLERTNSRDSVNEMETIQEGQEGDGESDDSSYSGSEYSWSTDDTDSRAGSVDPSPPRLSSSQSFGSDSGMAVIEGTEIPPSESAGMSTTASAITELANNTSTSNSKPPTWV